MKKTILFFLLIIWPTILFSKEFNNNGLILSLNMDINIVFESLGQPIENRIIHKYVDTDFNEYIVKYNDLVMYYFYGDSKISFISTCSPLYTVEVEGKKICCGDTKNQIEQLFGELILDYSADNLNVYSYAAENFTVLLCTFDKDEKLINIQFEHE